MREVGDIVREGNMGKMAEVTELSLSREHGSLDSNHGMSVEPRPALEIHEQNITAQKLALD